MADRTIYVGNVGASVDEFILRSIFENCGFVTQVRMAGKRGYDTVYCFVEFADPQQAITALAMNGLQLGDRQIRVSMAKAPARPSAEQRSGNEMMAINLIQAQAQARLMQLPAFNMLLPVSGVSTNNMVKAKRPHQDPDKVMKTVFVENVADDMDEQGIAEFFSACGEVKAVRLAGPLGSKKAWVEFGTKESARSAKEYDNTVLGSSTVRVRASKTAIHTNGLQREQDSTSGSKSPSPTRSRQTDSPNLSHNQNRATSSLSHPEVSQQPAQLMQHGQIHASGSPPLIPHPASTQMPPVQMGQQPQVLPFSQPQLAQPMSQPQLAHLPLQMPPSTAEIQQHLMTHMPQHCNGLYVNSPPGYMPGHAMPQQAILVPLPNRPASAARTPQNYAPPRSPPSGRTSPSLKRGYEDVHHSNAHAAAAAAYLSQQQAEEKRMRMH